MSITSVKRDILHLAQHIFFKISDLRQFSELNALYEHLWMEKHVSLMIKNDFFLF